MESLAEWASLLAHSSSSGNSLCDACKGNIISGYRLGKLAAIIKRILDGNFVLILICIGSNLGSCLVDDRFDNLWGNNSKTNHVGSSSSEPWASSCSRQRRSCRVRRESRFRSLRSFTVIGALY